MTGHVIVAGSTMNEYIAAARRSLAELQDQWDHLNANPEISHLRTELNCLKDKYQSLVLFYDSHQGTPCEQVRHKEEVDHLKCLLDMERNNSKELKHALSDHPIMPIGTAWTVQEAVKSKVCPRGYAEAVDMLLADHDVWDKHSLSTIINSNAELRLKLEKAKEVLK